MFWPRRTPRDESPYLGKAVSGRDICTSCVNAKILTKAEVWELVPHLTRCPEFRLSAATIGGAKELPDHPVSVESKLNEALSRKSKIHSHKKGQTFRDTQGAYGRHSRLLRVAEAGFERDSSGPRSAQFP